MKEVWPLGRLDDKDLVALLGVEVPVVVRFEGNSAAQGRQILADSGLNIIPAESLTDAAEKSVAAAGGAQ